MSAKLTKRQKAWCDEYEAQTGFDPMMDDFYAGNESFHRAARRSVLWFEDWASDVHSRISSNIPGEK